MGIPQIFKNVMKNLKNELEIKNLYEFWNFFVIFQIFIKINSNSNYLEVQTLNKLETTPLSNQKDSRFKNQILKLCQIHPIKCQVLCC